MLVQLYEMFSFSDISFHVLASCSQHAFDKWAGPYKCTNQNLYFKSQLKYTPIRKCHHSTQCYIGRSEYFHVRFAINEEYLVMLFKTQSLYMELLWFHFTALFCSFLVNTVDRLLFIMPAPKFLHHFPSCLHFTATLHL